MAKENGKPVGKIRSVEEDYGLALLRMEPAVKAAEGN